VEKDSASLGRLATGSLTMIQRVHRPHKMNLVSSSSPSSSFSSSSSSSSFSLLGGGSKGMSQRRGMDLGDWEVSKIRVHDVGFLNNQLK